MPSVCKAEKNYGRLRGHHLVTYWERVVGGPDRQLKKLACSKIDGRRTQARLWTHNAAASVSGLITVDSGTVTLGAANVFAGDADGVLLDDTRSTPAAAAWKSRPITRTANTYTGGTIV